MAKLCHWMVGPAMNGETAQIRRVPRAPWSAFTFNFPLTWGRKQVATPRWTRATDHLTPASQPPGSSFKMAELCWKPVARRWHCVVPCQNQGCYPLVEDNRIKLLMTGSPAVGWELKSRAGQKFVTRNGRHAGNMSINDVRSAYAAGSCRLGWFAYRGTGRHLGAGVEIHKRRYELVDELIRKSSAKSGQPFDEATDRPNESTRGAADRLGRLG